MPLNNVGAAWRFGGPTEVDFEPLLALRIEVMREDLERVGRFEPGRARRIFRGHFDELGMRLVLVDGQRAGCVGFRVTEDACRIDSLYLERRLHNSGTGTAILKALLAEADALELPVRLEVLTGSKAGRFYLRHGFALLSEDAIEGKYERPVLGPQASRPAS